MNKVLERFEARLRQIKAMDRNACDIYSDLAENCTNSKIKEALRQLAQDESRHQGLEEDMLQAINAHRSSTPR
jgi:rubrerythrin